MTLSEELAWRGFINQTTFDDIKKLDSQKWNFYHGFDASADSQQVGNLAAMMLDKAFMRHGHKAVILAGGATSLIGDPGGKDAERNLQEESVIASNVERAKQQLEKIFAGHDFMLVNNIDWTKSMSVLDFMRDIGKHFSMTPLVQRDYIAKRIGEGGSGISYTEFSYTLLQGMDFLHLYDNHGVTLQLGGSDQWGNCLSGVDLLRRARGVEAHVITLPLVINKATGKKFGKSEDGAVWLDDKKTSVYKFYQFWLNSSDDGVEGYLKIFTELDKEQIDEVMRQFTDNKAGRAAQKALAYEVTKLVHGQEKADSVKRVTEVLFSKDADYSALTDKDFEALKHELKTIEPQTLITTNLVEAGLAGSLSEAARFKEQGAVYANGKQIPAEKLEFDENDYLLGKYIILRRGKNLNAILQR